MERSNLFLVAAIWNFAIAGAGLLLPEFAASISLVKPYASTFAMLWMFYGLVLAFGIGYYLVWRDPVANRSIILLGIIGKTFVFFQVWALYLMQEGTLLFALAGTGDLIFAALFLNYLRKHPAS